MLDKNIDQVVQAFHSDNSPHFCCILHLASLEQYLADCYAVLSKEEQARADRYVVDPPRVQFSITRACLRLIMGKLLNKVPADLIFETNEWGKLYLPESDLNFNVSHTKEKAIILISPNQYVGIDIERIQPEFAAKNIANRFFSDAEKEWLAQFHSNELAEQFFNIWCGKEAVSKAIGLGMNLPLKKYDVIPKANTIKLEIPPNKLLNKASSWSLTFNTLDNLYAYAWSLGDQVDKIFMGQLY